MDVRLELCNVEERPARHVVPEVCIGFAAYTWEEIAGVAFFQRLEAYVFPGNDLILVLRP